MQFLLRKTEKFRESYIEKYKNEIKNEKQMKIIVKNAIGKFIAKILVKIKGLDKNIIKWEEFSYEENYDIENEKIIRIVQNLFKKMSIAPLELYIQYNYISLKETIFPEYLINTIKDWIINYRSKRPSLKSPEKIIPGHALVLYGSPLIDKKTLCSLICQKLGINVFFAIYKKMCRFLVLILGIACQNSISIK